MVVQWIPLVETSVEVGHFLVDALGVGDMCSTLW